MPASGSPAPSDVALVRALDVWGSGDAARLLSLFSDRWAGSILDAKAATDDSDPLRELRAVRIDEAGPDLSRVHWTWLVRALQDEPRSVRRVVVGASREPLRSILLRAFHLDPADLEPDRPADPAVRSVVLSLWTERLVGDAPPGRDDPEAIQALTMLASKSLFRLIRLAGEAKLASFSDAPRHPERRGSTDRFEDLRRRVGGPIDPRLNALAANDWAACRPSVTRLGLNTVGRLLATAEPHRVRWALQHGPYSVAKRLRAAANSPQAAVKAVQAWETRFFRAAGDRLEAEGRSTNRRSEVS